MIRHSINEATECRMCQSKDVQIAMTLKPSPLSDEYLKEAQEQEKYKLECLLCEQCGQFQLKQIVSPENIYTDYIYWSSSSPGLKRHFEDYCNSVLNYLKIDNGLALDIGCNEGLLLENFASKGLSICGIEPAKNICEHLTSAKIPHINDYMTRESALALRDQHGCPDIITTNNVFANVDNAAEFIAAVESIMSDKSAFIIEAGYLLDMLKNQVFDNIYHEHLSYFSLYSLTALLDRFSLKIFHATRIDTKGGSIRVYIQKASGLRPIDSSVDQLLAEEKAHNIHSLKTYHDFQKSIDHNGSQLKKYLEKQQAEGKKIVGYGASATVTTVLHHFDIGQYFSFLVDDNPIKHHTYSPGYGIPVKPSEVLDHEEVDIIVILPWRFADMIIEKNQNLIEKGIKIIKFLPKLEEIERP